MESSEFIYDCDCFSKTTNPSNYLPTDHSGEYVLEMLTPQYRTR